MFLRLFVIAAVFFFSTTANIYAEFELSGKILNDSRIFIDKGSYEEDSTGEFNKSISRLELDLQRIDEEGFSLFSRIWVTYDHLDSFSSQTHGTSDSTDDKKLVYDEIDLREAYVTANYGPLEIKAGQMTLNWGRTDEINPIDVVNPEDITEFYTIEKMERKMPILLLNCLLYLGDFTLQAALIPFFEPTVLPDRGPWAQKMLIEFKNNFPDIYNSLDFDDREGAGKRDIENAETAVRLTGLLGSLDIGLVFFYGYNDQPAIKIDFPNQMYEVIYKKFHGYGIDFAYSIEGYGFRGEFFYRDRVLYSYQQSIFNIDNHESADFQSVVGVDKIFGDNLLILLQVMYNRILDYKEDMIMDEEVIMGMGTIQDKFFREELAIAFDCYYGFKDKDWMIGPRIEYSLTDNLKVKATGFIVDGPEDADLGQFKNNDMVTLLISYNF